MIYIRKADFSTDIGSIREVRLAVFVVEQGVPEELEMDNRDPSCVHVLAFDGEKPVGTGRIDIELGGKVGRVAVVASERGLGIGRGLMQELHNIAEHSDLESVWCHAQVGAVPFYLQLGYVTVGDRFLEDHIEHVRMEKSSVLSAQRTSRRGSLRDGYAGGSCEIEFLVTCSMCEREVESRRNGSPLEQHV